MTVAAELLIVPIARVLVPGTRMSLRRSRGDLRPGLSMVVILRSEDPSPHEVGTLARVLGVRALDGGDAMIRLHGQHLVRVPPGASAGGETRAEVIEVDEVGPGVPVALDAVERALSRYMAVRAEAGFGGDVYRRLSKDPVVASHEVASHLQISWPELQELLEAGDASRRLKKGLEVMERETELLRRLLASEGS